MNITKFVALSAIAGSIFAGTAVAEDEALFSGYAGADVASGYISRGRLLTDEFALQPYAGICFGGFDLNIWAHQDLEKDEENEMEEIDYELSYSGNIDSFTYSVAGIIYAYDNCDNDYLARVKFGYDNDIVVPTISALYQIRNSDGSDGGLYTKLELSKDFALCDKLSLGLAASIGYANEDYREASWGVADAGFVDAVGAVSLSYSVTDQLSVSAGCSYNVLADSDLEDVEEEKQADGESEHFIASVGFEVAF